jgi:hypothetical protein
MGRLGKVVVSAIFSGLAHIGRPHIPTTQA